MDHLHLHPDDTRHDTRHEEHLQRLHEGVEHARHRASAAEQYRARLERLRVTGHHEGVTVVLGHTGALVDVRLEEPLRRALLAANAVARGRLVDQVTELTAEAFGVASATTGAVVEAYERALQGAAPVAAVGQDRPVAVLR
ncbi:hypothetical protein [Nocardioides nanhaiensis]|uniref:YbaB/EbfC family DNA-binding protein n=1 Tax=Nocardioides nanhaiensis TaxID=1476871 RepID=A0ABP8W5U0_9ACTN